MKNRLSDPSEICALDGVIGSAEKRPSATTNGRFGERRTKPGSRYLAR